MATPFNHEKTYRIAVNRNYQRIARIVQAIISSHVSADGRLDDPVAMTTQLARYSESLVPWTQTFWGQIINRQVFLLNGDWKKAGIIIPPDSPIVQSLLTQQLQEEVNLITTLPTKAALQAQEIAAKAATATGDRAAKYIEQLQGLQPGYPEFAARRLARTEIAKTQSLIVRTQALEVGIRQYIWRTVKDEDVRESHADMEGKICDFDNPPEVEPGQFYHPGGIYNCRCYAEPLLP